MPGNAGTVAQLALSLGRALTPLKDALASDKVLNLFSQLGVRFPAEITTQPNFATALLNATNAATQLTSLNGKLEIAINASNVGQITATVGNLIDSIKGLIRELDNIAGQLPAAAIAVGFDGTEANDFAAHLVNKLLNYTIIRYLEGYHSGLLSSLSLSGLIDRLPVPGSSQTKPNYFSRDIRLDRLSDLLFASSTQLRVLYGWNEPGFDGTELLRRLRDVLMGLAVPVYIDDRVSPPVLRLFSVDVAPTVNTIPRGLRGTLRSELPGDIKLRIPLFSDSLSLDIVSDNEFKAGTSFTVQPPAKISFQPPAGSIQGITRVSLVKSSGGTDPLVLLGTTGGSGLKAMEIQFGVASVLQWDAGANTAQGELLLSLDIHQGNIVLDLSDADGFISTILPSGRIDFPFELSAGWSAQRGLFFKGSAGPEVNLPLHVSLSSVGLDQLYLSLKPESKGLNLEASVAVRAKLAALNISVERIGFESVLKLERGNLGPVDLSFAFKAPSGLGLSIDSGGFKGGGFLFFNEEKGEYAGALELDFQGFISVKAIGVINTKMPDGSAGFSLLIVISAEFTPIQLSFGFTLNGVGGIIGLSRTIFVSALAEGVRTNAIKSILFPENIVANISRIVSDIKQFFPPLDDHFVVGPMGKLGWGTPSIITLELGLLLDLPNPMFAIVGVLKAVLPDESAPLLRLQVNFVGVLDFDHGYIFFRADLYDSRLLLFSLTGSMAFLVSWGEQQTFALSVGGFHPDFRDFPSIPALPDGFRNMARIGISLLSDDNPRLKIECYFAVTSNTVQFGAKVELYAEAVGFNVYGFLGYDVLFQFDPFRFIASLYGGIALREDTSVIAGINILARLAGPGLWDTKGEAGLTILFIEISIDFHVTWGDPPPAIEPATEDLLALLKRELANTGNWRAELPPNNHFGVTLKKIEPPVGEELLVIYPAGVLTFSQRSLPLEDYLIQKYGNKKPLKENRFKLTNANSNGKVIPADFQGVRELFAPGNFTELSDSDKLSRKSFDLLPSGFKLTATSDLVVGKSVSRPVRYELNYLRRKQFQLIFVGVVDLAARAYDRLVKSSAVRQSALSLQQTRKSLNAPAEVHLPQEMFALASTANLKSHLYDGQNAVLFATQAEAYQKHQEMISQTPALAGQIQVVSHYELNQG